MQAAIYKEDFEREREDRTKAAGKVESLERQKESQLPQNQQKEEVKRLQKEISQLHRQLSSTQRDLASSREEVQAKVSQVKQYKKQLDTQEAKVCHVYIFIIVFMDTVPIDIVVCST